MAGLLGRGLGPGKGREGGFTQEAEQLLPLLLEKYKDKNRAVIQVQHQSTSQPAAARESLRRPDQTPCFVSF